MTRKRSRLWRFALVLALVAGALGVAAAAFLYVLYAQADTSTVGELRFRNALRIPALLEPTSDGQGRKVFDLRMQTGSAELIAGKRTKTWGYNGAYLGPTLRASRGERVLIRVRNELPRATTTTHWHGMHLPAPADGGPHQEIKPGETWRPRWRVSQPAATLWYHPHLHERTEEHVYRGLAGMVIVDDRREARLPLPRRYGVDDVPVMIQDKRLEDDGQLDYSQAAVSPTGRLGGTLLVNGTYDPHFEVTRERTRLRLVNASTARVYELGFSDGRRFALIATEQGLLERPAGIRRIRLAPGERAEIVVGIGPRERVVLRSFEPQLGADFFNDRFSGGDDSFDVLQLRAARRLSPSPPLPKRLAVPSPAPEPARTRRFELTSSSKIDGRKMDMERIDRVVPRGQSELWEVRNPTGIPHTFHPHGTSFTVLERAGERPPPQLRARKDNVLVPPGETVRLLVSGFGYPDRDTPFMFHCHLLQHEDRGMMGQLVVR